MKPEAKARQNIDGLLEAAGWKVQWMHEANLAASLGVAVREVHLKPDFADYLLFVDGQPIGVVEAKPEGTTLSGVAEQSSRYLTGVGKLFAQAKLPPPFAHETTGVETFFRDQRDPQPRSRRLFAFHRPETFQEWISQPKTLRARLREMPSLEKVNLRECQLEAILKLERSFAEDRSRSLIQMASGAGKTYTAVSFVYRLIKFANAKRILFLVDRGNLGRQTLREFQQYITPDDGRKFTELYNVQRLTSNAVDPVNKVVITTIQRLYSMLKGEAEFAEENEEQSIFEVAPQAQAARELVYNPQFPIEFFDFIITDECHRSIYHLWRQTLDYFDAFLIGLTATPSKQTLGFFNQNLVTEYSHERAVADGVNVGFDVYRIKTQITEQGSKVEAGFYIDRRDKLTRKLRYEQLDEDLEYAARQLDRDVVSHDQIRTIIRAFRDHLFTDLFPGRTEVPKTLIFAKDDSHAEDIVHLVREEFGKGNEFCKKITYRTPGEKPDDLIASFRNSYHPRIAVTVDMIATGTDVRPLECVVFMRDVKSSVYFEQMKGRGTRTVSDTDLKAVTPDAEHKTHFIIVDAVGVCESDKTDSRPLERKRTVPFDKLLQSVALGLRDEDTITSLAGRLARLDRAVDDADRAEILNATGGALLRDLAGMLLDGVNPDRQVERAKQQFATEAPTDEQVQQAAEALVKLACAPFDDPKLRNTLIDIHRKNEQTIDTVSKDAVLSAEFDATAKDRAQQTVASFRKLIDENKDELTALQIIYNQPYGQRRLTYEQIKQVADAVGKPPYQLAPERVWRAYEQLERSKVRGAGPQRLLTDLVSIIRFTIGEAEVLEPFRETVDHRFTAWLAQQEQAGRGFTTEQREWLTMIKDHIATSLAVSRDDFELEPFYEKGGLAKVYQLFGSGLDGILDELNELLAA